MSLKDELHELLHAAESRIQNADHLAVSERNRLLDAFGTARSAVSSADEPAVAPEPQASTPEAPAPEVPEPAVEDAPAVVEESPVVVEPPAPVAQDVPDAPAEPPVADGPTDGAMAAY